MNFSSHPIHIILTVNLVFVGSGIFHVCCDNGLVHETNEPNIFSASLVIPQNVPVPSCKL